MQPMKLPSGVMHIMSCLTRAGYHVYVVGGCVRDALRGISPHDYDMTTDATPEEMQTVFRNHRVVETGIRHGTLTILWEGTSYEVTTYRVDGDYRDHRHPDDVTFTRSLTEDLARRDFTMNAIAYHPDEGYIDPFHGYADIEAGIVRAVGDPHRRFEEDALRILRALRFASVLGYAIESATVAAAFDKKDLLRHVSAERIREELCKLLTGVAVAEVLRRYFPILTDCLPDVPPPSEDTLRAITALPCDPALRLVALVHPAIGCDSDRMESIMRALRFDNTTRRHTAILIGHMHAPLSPDRPTMLRLLSRIGISGVRDLCEIRAALAPREADRVPLRQAAALADALVESKAPYRITDLAVNGDDLLTKTSLRGAAVGTALSSLLAAVIDEKVENAREALLHYIITAK